MQNEKNETTTATTQNKGGFLDVLFRRIKGGITGRKYFDTETIEVTMSPKEIMANFAINNGYAESTISDLLIEKVILPGNEEIIKSFAKGEIDESDLKEKIGFEESFAEMYFDISKVDIAAIENQLQSLKRSIASKEEMKRWALLISLYCYLIEEQVPCGPKNKVPKRNKGLKPENLRAQIS